jgi:CrcB protein
MNRILTEIMLVGAGGFVGSALRYVSYMTAARWFSAALYPVGTLFVNVTGCFLVGCAGGWVAGRGFLAHELRLFFVVGLLGGFTTFSAFGLETHQLHVNQQSGAAILNIALQVILSLVAVSAGYHLSRSL